MHTLNDDDMEDLFRRAGEQYPLKTNGSDWNKVMQKLDAVKDDLPQQNKNKKDYRYLLLMLLLPLGFICGRYIGNNNEEEPAKTKKKNTITTMPASKTGQETQNAAITGARPIKKTENIAGNKASHSVANLANNTPANNKLTEKEAVTTSKTNSLLIKNSLTGTLVKERGKVATKNVVSATPSEPASDLNNRASKKDIFTNIDTIKKTSVVSQKDRDIGKKNEGTTKNQKTFKKYLYYSLLAGPDLSTIKLQRVKKTGYSIGLLLGYHFTKRISVEGGLLWDKKNYYTKGEYLDTNRLKLPTHTIVLNATGDCSMIEIPVTLTYDFLTKPNYSWFVSAGASSYLMKKEQYNLSYQRYNVPYVKDYGYNNSSKNWFTLLNISAGYQKTIGKNTSISVAPYVKIPLKGVGIGKIPITSTGVYLSLSRTLH